MFFFDRINKPIKLLNIDSSWEYNWSQIIIPDVYLQHKKCTINYVKHITNDIYNLITWYLLKSSKLDAKPKYASFTGWQAIWPLNPFSNKYNKHTWTVSLSDNSWRDVLNILITCCNLPTHSPYPKKIHNQKAWSEFEDVKCSPNQKHVTRQNSLFPNVNSYPSILKTIFYTTLWGFVRTSFQNT